MKSNGALPSIPHPNREQAPKRARLSAGFPNIVNGQRIDPSKRMRIFDPVTGEELASVTDTQKDGLGQAVQAAKAAFPLWSSKTWKERRDLLANAMKELKAHTDELCTILTAENGRAIDDAETLSAAVLAKARFWDIDAAVAFNERQRKIVNQLLNGFVGKLTSSKWAKLAKCSQDTALRDIEDLVRKGILQKDPAGGRSTSYSLREPARDRQKR